MNIEDFRNYCLNKPGVSEGFPFDASTLVFKVGGKMFALTDIDLFESVNLKCDPEWAVALRDSHDEIQPGFHMNKKHWNTVMINGSLNDDFIIELMDHSYQLVFDSLSLKIRESF